MKKIIDIPDEIVKDLKILAVKEGKDFKTHLQDVISRHFELSNITEMASYGIEDGQSMRFVWNYLMKTYEGIKGEKFDYEQSEFKTLVSFLEYVSYVCDYMVKMEKEEEGFLTE